MKREFDRPAIAMIELIFAIVIMGIVMMSAPMLISTAKKTVDVALQQEGINQAITRINEVLTYEWDEGIVSSGCTPIVHVVSGDPELDENATGYRIGVNTNSDARSFRCPEGPNEFNASATLGSEAGDKDDIDDYIEIEHTTLDTRGNALGIDPGIDYIEATTNINSTVDINTSVYYSSDTADYNNASFTFNFDPANTSGTSTNIKTISVTLTSSSGVDELNKTIVLNAFSCNIGDSSYMEPEE